MRPWEQTAKDPNAARMLRNEEHHIRDLRGLDEVDRIRRATLSRWKSAVKRGVAEGTLRPVDPSVTATATATATAIADTVLGAYRHLPPIGRMRSDQVAKELATVLLDGLRAC